MTELKNNDLKRLRAAAEKLFSEFMPSEENAKAFKVGKGGGRFWVGDMSTWDRSPEALAFIEFLIAARDVGIDKEGTFKRHAEEHERRRKRSERPSIRLLPRSTIAGRSTSIRTT